MFPEVVNKIFGSKKDLFPKMPAVECLASRKTVHLPLGLIPHDESSNTGNLAVLENIFRNQYGLAEQRFEKALFLIYGDQKTVQRIRTIKRRRRDSIRAYDSLKWALPVPALFHLKMNLLFMLLKCHFGGEDRDQSTLYDAMNFWNRKKISKAKADFFALEELVIHSFQARIVAIMWHKLSRTGLGRHMEDIEALLRKLSPSGFGDLVDEVQKAYSFSVIPDPSSIEDGEARNHILFLQQTQTYLLLKHAIKHADIGLIRRAIDRCCVYFHGSGQHKYAYEMLYLQRLFLASDSALTRAILSNSLVNLRGGSDTWFETDRLVELHNGNMKRIYKAKRGSAITLEHLFQLYSLNSTYITNLNQNVEHFFGMQSNSDHTSKSARTDIRFMAERLAAGSIVNTRGRTVKYPALDALTKGALQLAGAPLSKFNANEYFDDRGFVDELLKSLLEEEPAGEAVDGFFDHPDSD